jgi:hypothetical protein
MKHLVHGILSFCLFVGLASQTSHARDSVLTAISSDAVVIAVVHDPTETSQAIDDIAKLVQAPAPDLLNLVKKMSGLQQGLDEHGDLAVVLTGNSSAFECVILVPVADSESFFAALKTDEPTTGIVEVKIADTAMLVGRKANYAAFAPVTQRDALEKFLASATNLTADASLTQWIDSNKVSIIVTSPGLQQLLPELISGIREMQAQITRVGGEQAKTASDAFNLYIDLFTAAESEVDQFGIGLRVDDARTVDIVKRIRFTPGGACARGAADAKPVEQDLLAGSAPSPFVFALGCVTPEAATVRMMEFSAQTMQMQPQFHLTPEQVQKYIELSTATMRGVKSMQMVMRVGEPGTGVYGNTSVVVLVDDSHRFMEEYQNSLEAMRELAQETNSPVIPVATTQQIRLGEREALEVSMNFQDIKALAPANGVDMQRIMELMFGKNDNLKVYVAPANDHAVVMAYVSPERLTAALDFYNSHEPGLSDNSGVAKVAAALPAGSQLVAYLDVSGLSQVVKEVIKNMPAVHTVEIPDIPNNPPLGMAAVVTPLGIEGHVVVTAETLQAIGGVVAELRHPTAASIPLSDEGVQ